MPCTRRCHDSISASEQEHSLFPGSASGRSLRQHAVLVEQRAESKDAYAIPSSRPRSPGSGSGQTILVLALAVRLVRLGTEQSLELLRLG